MDPASSHGDVYEEWSTQALFALLCVICRILEGRQPLAGVPRGDPPDLEGSSWHAGSSSSWGVISGPPCASFSGASGLAAQRAASATAAAAPSGDYLGGGPSSASSGGSAAGLRVPFDCGYRCHYCELPCSRNKERHAHHRCFRHRRW